MVLEYFYQALSTPIGIVLQCPEGSRDYWRNRLYNARREAGDEALNAIQVRFSPITETELWLVRTNNGVSSG